jgi:ribose-phosphate pyrophosphokinase
MPAATLLLHFEDELSLARKLADAAGLTLACVDRHVFPDGELKLRLPNPLPSRVVLLRSLHNPNAKLVELLLAAHTARTLGAQHLTLVTPYLAYMRQDVAFQSGEAVSQKIIGRHLADLFDAVITVDPHLHRVATLKEAVPATQALALTAAPLLAEFVHQQCPDAMLIGPDEESEQWITAAARQHQFDHGVCRKTRHGDREVEITLPDVAVAGRAVVLLDDIASSGHTLAQAAPLLLRSGARSVDVAVTHALFSGDALQVVREAGVGHIWSTDSVPHESNCIGLAGLLAAALHQL